jgi:magnesium-protoporphyrin IX monomethyl ester (oxidative) cyclase
LNELYQFIQAWDNLFYVSDEAMLRKKVSDQRPVLAMREEEGCLAITDTRPCAVQREILLEGLAAEIYRACDAAQTPEQLVKLLQENGNPGIAWSEVQPIVERLRAQKILLPLDGRFISLAVSEPCIPLQSFDESPLGLVMLRRSKPREDR